MPLKQVQKKIQDFLWNGEPMWKIRPSGSKAKILVGHALDHDIECLGIEYPTIMIRYGTSTLHANRNTNRLFNTTDSV